MSGAAQRHELVDVYRQTRWDYVHENGTPMLGYRLICSCEWTRPFGIPKVYAPIPDEEYATIMAQACIDVHATRERSAERRRARRTLIR